jgi:hypothetical protein
LGRGSVSAESVRARMQAIARAIDDELPDGYGFFVLCFPFNMPPDARAEYASNAKRKDVVAAMKEFIKRNPMTEPEKN